MTIFLLILSSSSPLLLMHSLPRAQEEPLSSPKLAANGSQIGWCLFYKILSYLEQEIPTCKLLTVCSFVWMFFIYCLRTIEGTK